MRRWWWSSRWGDEWRAEDVDDARREPARWAQRRVSCAEWDSVVHALVREPPAEWKPLRLAPEAGPVAGERCAPGGASGDGSSGWRQAQEGIDDPIEGGEGPGVGGRRWPCDEVRGGYVRECVLILLSTMLGRLLGELESRCGDHDE